MLDELGEVHGKDIAVRVNSVSSELMEQDMNVIMTAKNLPKTILLPKTNTVDDLIVVRQIVDLSFVMSHQKICSPPV
jgi:citrate lyase subunit beta-like protein